VSQFGVSTLSPSTRRLTRIRTLKGHSRLRLQYQLDSENRSQLYLPVSGKSIPTRCAFYQSSASSPKQSVLPACLFPICYHRSLPLIHHRLFAPPSPLCSSILFSFLKPYHLPCLLVVRNLVRPSKHPLLPRHSCANSLCHPLIH
jgi:hypothetical protein